MNKELNLNVNLFNQFGKHILGSDCCIASKSLFIFLKANDLNLPLPNNLEIRKYCVEYGCSFDVPTNISSFVKCNRLLELFPHWKDSFKLIGVILPGWKPFLRNWKKLQSLYYSQNHKALFKLIKKLELKSIK